MEPPASDGTRRRPRRPRRRPRLGDEWIARHVATNGVITVAYQQVSVGAHLAGRTVDVRARPETLEVWDANELIKTVARTTKGGIRKKRAASR